MDKGWLVDRTGVLLSAVFALVLLVSSCNPFYKNTPTPTPTPKQPVTVVLDAPLQPFKGGPRLASRELSLDFGQVHYNERAEAVFHLENVGDSTLILEGPLVRVEEGCCPPLDSVLGKSTLGPGESTFIRTVFTMASEGMGGKHTFGVLLRSNDPVQPEKRLEIKADFIP